MPKQKRQIPKLHLYHIPRTGGMSIGLHMRRHNRTKQHPKRIGYHISGHAHYRKFSPSYFTLIGLRDPTEHAASLYKYISRARSHKQHDQVKAMTFLEYIEFSRDSYLGFLTSKRKRTLRQALINLQSISFVYLTQNLDTNLRIFLKYLDAQLDWHPTRFNATGNLTIKSKHRKAVNRNRPHDVAIYQAAQQLNKVQLIYFKKNRRTQLTPDLDWSGVIV